MEWLLAGPDLRALKLTDRSRKATRSFMELMQEAGRRLEASVRDGMDFILTETNYESFIDMELKEDPLGAEAGERSQEHGFSWDEA